MTTKLYPHLDVSQNAKPNRLYAFPFFGLLIKVIMIIPVSLWLFLLSIVFLFYWLILPFYILFTGKYWDSAFNFLLGLLRLSTKVSLFIYGITDKYPGFGLNDGGLFKLEIEKPKKVNRLLAFPIFGFIARFILLIPYLIFSQVLAYGSNVAMLFSWFIVLFKKKYPESLYEFIRDYVRVSAATTAYLTYMSDDYPSFWISMKHQTIKILLLIAGAALMFGNFTLPSENNQDTEIENQSTFTIVPTSSH